MSSFDPFNDLESIKDEWQRQHREEVTEKVIDAIIAVIFLVALVWLLWPKNVTAWHVDIFGYHYVREDKPVIELISYDDQKLLDKWKHNVKSEYVYKFRTMNATIWEFLTSDMGLSDECAAGIFGNMMVECGNRSFDLHPYVYSPGGSYYGLCQWNTFGHHSSIAGGTLEEQLLYLRDTISSEMGESNYNRFISASTPEEAANIFGQWYERCYAPYGRQNEARRAYDLFRGRE